MDDLTGTLLGDYHIYERIGRGGMSVVYRASKQDGSPDVAIKVMDTAPDTRELFLKRFEQEAHIVNEMDHPNILPLLDYGLHNGYPYMVMPLMTGGTLGDILRKHPLSQTDAGGWLYQIAMALDHAHSRGVIHRDLKPTNILLDDRGHAFLTDFGIARLLNLTSSLTMTGNVVGTPTYMAPEQWRGEEATPLTDIYGLGILVYLMLTGHPPFKADTPHALMYKHLNEPPPPISVFVEGVKPEVDAVVRKAIAKLPSERYQSAMEFSQDYQRALHGLETLAQRYPPSQPKRSTASYTVQIDSYRTPSSLSKPKEDDIYQSIPSPYNPNILQNLSVQPIAKKRRARQRRTTFRKQNCLLIVFVILVLGGLAFEIVRRPEAYLPRQGFPIINEQPAPTVTSIPGIRPKAVIFSPANGQVFGVGEEVVIRIGATDTINVSKIEIRRFGYVLEIIENPSSSPNFETTYTYIPRQMGTHLLEIVPYRGSLAGDAAFIEIEAR
ncbi:MAG: hypothetical protein CUN55_11340 [Phototrophicales bacterium]|nr:MAG: hypothetical protein CUN55_11340 [Phototrophicales bacterium]